MFWEVGLLVTTLAAAISTSIGDEPPQGGSGIDTAGSIINKSDPFGGLDANGVIINQTELLTISDEDIDFYDENSIEERKGCSPTVSCTRAGGSCIKGRARCTGTVDKDGCKGGKKCKCCIPDQTTQAPSTCPAATACPTCPGPTVNPNLSWMSVGSDRFVRFSSPMSWSDARTLCQANGLDLYEPKNITSVTKYLDDNFSSSWYWVGARGNGVRHTWLSGGVIPNSTLWYSNSHYNDVGTDKCIYIAARSYKMVLTIVCTWSSNIIALCG